MKIQICSLLVTLIISLRVIMIPPSGLHLYLLGYLSAINLSGWRQQRNTEHEASTPHLFCRGAFKTFNIAYFLFSVQITLGAPKIMYLGTYKIFSDALQYGRSIKSKNQDSERTGTIASSVLNLYSSYTDPYLLSEFIQIG